MGTATAGLAGQTLNRWRPASLAALLRWAHAEHAAETPNLEHAVGQHASDGAPLMRYAARAFLGLMDPRNVDEERRADDWLRLASRTDPDGRYRTPLRRAIATLPPERRYLARALVSEQLMPGDVALVAGIPEWCAGDVLYRTMSMLWERYLDRPLISPGWLERSDASRNAIIDGERSTDGLNAV